MSFSSDAIELIFFEVCPCIKFRDIRRIFVVFVAVHLQMNAQLNFTMAAAGYLRVGSGAEWKSGAAVIVLESNRFVRFA